VLEGEGAESNDQEPEDHKDRTVKWTIEVGIKHLSS
jgi:hypothetical protein